MPDQSEVGNPVSPCPYAKQEAKPNEEKHFISFNLVDEKGAGVPNVTLNVKLPDGSYEEKTSDKDGKIRINNIKPGTCKIEFEWKKLTMDKVVMLQS